MISLHPNYLEKNGKREFVVLPAEEFDTLRILMEDFEDLQDLRKAKKAEGKAPTCSLAEAKAKMKRLGRSTAE